MRVGRCGASNGLPAPPAITRSRPVQPLRNANVKVIAATHRDLRKMVERERFRTDLFYRLSMIERSICPGWRFGTPGREMCGSWRTCRDTPARCAKETWSTSTIFPRHSFRQPIRSKSRTMRRLAPRPVDPGTAESKRTSVQTVIPGDREYTAVGSPLFGDLR